METPNPEMAFDPESVDAFMQDLGNGPRPAAVAGNPPVGEGSQQPQADDMEVAVHGTALASTSVALSSDSGKPASASMNAFLMSAGMTGALCLKPHHPLGLL